MKTTELIRPSRAPIAPESLPNERSHVSPSASEPSSVREMVEETGPLVGVIAGFGPPVVSLAGPWLLFVLALAGPFALVFTFVVVLVAVTLLILLAGTILASPYLLVRHLRKHRTGHAAILRPAVQPAFIESPRAAS
jgi:hypothetical protein